MDIILISKCWPHKRPLFLKQSPGEVFIKKTSRLVLQRKLANIHNISHIHSKLNKPLWINPYLFFEQPVLFWRLEEEHVGGVSDEHLYDLLYPGPTLDRSGHLPGARDRGQVPVAGLLGVFRDRERPAAGGRPYWTLQYRMRLYLKSV